MKKLINILIFGGIWGFAEATLGFVLHLFTLNLPGVTGFFMFPIALFCMSMAAKNTEGLNSALYVSCIAALIKLTDLFMPIGPAIKVINPALSIMLQGLVVYGFLYYMYNKDKNLSFVNAFAMSASWRIIYVLYLLILPFIGMLLPLQSAQIINKCLLVSPISGFIPFTRFIFFESAINAIIIFSALGAKKLVLQYKH